MLLFWSERVRDGSRRRKRCVWLTLTDRENPKVGVVVVHPQSSEKMHTLRKTQIPKSSMEVDIFFLISNGGGHLIEK